MRFFTPTIHTEITNWTHPISHGISLHRPITITNLTNGRDLILSYNPTSILLHKQSHKNFRPNHSSIEAVETEANGEFGLESPTPPLPVRREFPRPEIAVRCASNGAPRSAALLAGTGSVSTGKRGKRIVCYANESGRTEDSAGSSIQLYGQIESLITETARQTQYSWKFSRDWSEVEGAWVLRPKDTKPTCIVHFIGGIFVGAAPQITYRLFLERLAEKGILVIATPYASGFDHFVIADEAQFKFDRCLRFLQDTVNDLPTFGIGHSLGSVVHILIGSRYAVQRSGNIFMSFNNKEASTAIPLFSPVVVPMAQSFGQLFSQINTSSTVRLAEMAVKQIENLSPVMKQVLPLIEQLPPLYMDLANGREDFIPKPEETRRLIKAYYGVSRNLLVKFKDDAIDETPTLARVLSSESAISSSLDMSMRTLPGDHGLPLQQILPDVPPVMADAVNKGGELFANLAVGTPWETVAKEVSNTFGPESGLLRANVSKDVDALVDVITSWMVSNSSSRLLPPQQ